MKFYVASKYKEREKVRIVFSELRRLGHEITLDWTNHDIYPNDAVIEKLGQFAEDDVEGVRQADAFIGCLLNDHAYMGLWVEMGVALALEKPCYLIGSAGDSCIFTNHRLVKKFSNFPTFYNYLECLAPNQEGRLEVERWHITKTTT